MADSKVSRQLGPPQPRVHTLQTRLYSLEGLPWPTAWEKHRRLAEVLETQEGAENAQDSRRK